MSRVAEIEENNRFWNEAKAAERERIAKMIEDYTPGQMRLACGEMTAQEMRTVQAVQRWWAAAIRHGE